MLLSNLIKTLSLPASLPSRLIFFFPVLCLSSHRRPWSKLYVAISLGKMSVDKNEDTTWDSFLTKEFELVF